MRKPEELISEALKKGQSTLSEYGSKQILAYFGIPVCREAIAYDVDSAAPEAERIGFPIALKACGAGLTHKTELGGVVLNIRSQKELKGEGERLLGIRGCEALLVQEMVHGHRELTCGLSRNRLFGPCIMFGLGGVLTEILEDVIFRLAPITPSVAREMVQDIRSRRILEAVRGEAAVDIEALAKTLVTLGEIALQHEAIAEVDINPLRIRPDGKPVSVDALVVVKAI
jgi:acetyl-CoA synthetase (ADP-forming)